MRAEDITGELTELEKQELEREDAMDRAGRDRFTSRLEKQAKNSYSITSEAHRLTSEALSKVSEKIKRMIDFEENREHPNTTKSIWYNDVVQLDTDVLAYIGLNTLWDISNIKGTLTTAMTTIGRKIELELWQKGLKEFDPKFSKRLELDVKQKHSSYRYRVKAARIKAMHQGYTTEKWKDKRCVQAATPVINAIFEEAKVFDIFTVKTPIYNKAKAKIGVRDKKYITTTKEIDDVIDDRNFYASWMEPCFAPMVVPPNPWTSFTTGCYLRPELAESVPLVRDCSFKQKSEIEDHFKNDIPNYVKALNALQATPLTINNYVRDAVEWAWSNKKEFGKFPRSSSISPPQYSKKDFEAFSDQEMRDYKGICRDILLENKKIDADRSNMKTDLQSASELAEYEQFYMPWSFCKRGRMYPVCHFNYHREDHVKSMIQFANGKPIGATGADWLLVHIANTGDFDKISKGTLEERYYWAVDNEELILQCGRDYESSYEIWSQADKPFAFLAACQAFVGYKEQGEDYVCHISPALDGTNSGIQHFSAMVLNKDDGHLVNLTKAERPQDIYQAVATNVETSLKTKTFDTFYKKGANKKETDKEVETYRKQWLDYGITRKTCKRNCMTYGYSSGAFGMADQIVDDLMKPLERERMYGRIKKHPFGDKHEQEKISQFLARINYHEIDSLISSVSNAMKFLQAAAGAVSHENKSLRWKTPVGFPVVQKYTTWDVTPVRIFLYDRELNKRRDTKVSVRQGNPVKIHKKKMKAAVAANFVHSMDASHMCQTILRGLDEGITDWMCIHDSFGTTCDRTNDLFHIVRETFVEQYKDTCLLGDFLKTVRQTLDNPNDDRLLPVPEKGTLDINEILESKYCFS